VPVPSIAPDSIGIDTNDTTTAANAEIAAGRAQRRSRSMILWRLKARVC
jgi:hypothetical protein